MITNNTDYELRWLDSKGFVRDEKASYSYIDEYFLPKIWMLLIPVMNVVYILIFIFKLLSIPYVFPHRSRKRQEIINNAYDIEATDDHYKLIRNEKGQMGLCLWFDYFDNELLLPSEYDDIQFGDVDNCFIICKDSKYGLYDAFNKVFVIEQNYDSIVNEKDDVFVLYKDGVMTKRNSKGDRIIF